MVELKQVLWETILLLVLMALFRRRVDFDASGDLSTAPNKLSRRKKNNILVNRIVNIAVMNRVSLERPSSGSRSLEKKCVRIPINFAEAWAFG